MRSRIEVIVYGDGSVEVSDDGRGMPVDIHPEEGIPGVELILTRLHAGGKFSGKNYNFSGGLHGVGVSVVNALSSRVEVTIRRDGNEYRMAFEHGDRASDLEVIGTVPKKKTGTTVRFWADPKYFDSPKILAVEAASHLLRAKAVLCAGLSVKLTDEASGEVNEWHYEDGLRDYLRDELEGSRSTSGRTVRAPRAARGRWFGRCAGVAAGRRAGAGKLRQPDSHRAGRHPCERPAHRPHQCDPRVLRHPQPVAARREAGAGRRVGAPRLRALRASCRTRSSPARPRSGCRRARPPAWSRASSTTPSACGSTSTSNSANASRSSPSSAPARA